MYYYCLSHLKPSTLPFSQPFPILYSVHLFFAKLPYKISFPFLPFSSFNLIQFLLLPFLVLISVFFNLEQYWKKMKSTLSLGPHTFFFLLVLFLVLSVGKSLHPHHFTYHVKGANIGVQNGGMHPKEGKNEELGMELYPTGSSLPDCAHACGPCFPCRRVMISFRCASMTESCPVIYRCSCRGRYYHVPSN